MVVSLLLMKINSRWVKWIPFMVFFLAALILLGKAEFFPGEGMADLGERIYFMALGTSAIGSIVGGLIVFLIKK
jgi:membrane protein YqaA with SNARE-associated domain